MGNGLALVQLAAGQFVANGRPRHAVEQPFGQIGSGSQVLEALLILYPDGCRAKLRSNADRGDVHLALEEHLGKGQLPGLVGSKIESHPLGQQPPVDRAGLAVLHSKHPRVEGGLAQPLLVDACRVEKVIGDDRVEHAHAALVEHSHDDLLPPQAPRARAACLCGAGRDADARQRPRVRRVVPDPARGKPRAKPSCEERVREVLAPERAVAHARLGQRGVQVEQPDETGKRAAPVCHGEDRPAVGGQSGQQMLAVLPHRLGHDQGAICRDAPKDLHAALLAVDESVPLGPVIAVGAQHPAPLLLDGGNEEPFHCGLGLLAFPVCGEAEIAVGNKIDDAGVLGHEWGRLEMGADLDQALRGGLRLSDANRRNAAFAFMIPNAQPVKTIRVCEPAGCPAAHAPGAAWARGGCPETCSDFGGYRDLRLGWRAGA